MDKYGSYQELVKNEPQDNYLIERKQGATGIFIAAPHGGNIELGTTELARAIAGDEHSFYSFIGLKENNPRDLHITSHNFDEPTALEMAGAALATVTIHGFKEKDELVYLGGRDDNLASVICKSLKDAGFEVKRSAKYKGTHPHNICNRNQQCKGVQLEISSGLRHRFFEDLWTWYGREKETELFRVFVQVIRDGLAGFFTLL